MPDAHVDRTRILLTEIGLETGEREFGRLQARRGVDRPHTGRDHLAISVRHEFHRIANDAYHARLHEVFGNAVVIVS